MCDLLPQSRRKLLVADRIQHITVKEFGGGLSSALALKGCYDDVMLTATSKI